MAAVIVAYLPAMNGGFICDDNDDVVGNATLQSLQGLYEIWFQPGISSQFYPFTFTSFWLNVQAGGLDPFGFHFINVLLHAANALLLWSLLRRLQVPGAWLAAGLFALHPVQVESVAYISERKNVLSGFFFFFALLAAIEFWLPEPSPQKVSRDGREGVLKDFPYGVLTKLAQLFPLLPASQFEPGGFFRIWLEKWKFYFLAIGFYLCALLSKTAVLPLPAVIFILIWWRRRPMLRDVYLLMPMALAGAAMGLITMHLENRLIAHVQPWTLSWLQRCLLASRDIWFYLGKLVWPHPLIFTYPRWTIDPTAWSAYVPLVALAAILLVLWPKRGSWGRPCLVALAYFAALLFLTLGFFNVYMFRYTFVSDHFQYLACVGPFALAAVAITTLLGRWQNAHLIRHSSSVVALTLLLIAGVLTWHQAAMYADPETLWQSTLMRNPACAMAEVNLGEVYRQQQQDSQKAIDCYRQAVRIDPNDYEAYCDLSASLVVCGQYADAIAQGEKAVRLNPDEVLGLDNLAWLLATCPDPKFRDGPRAVILSEHACQLTRNEVPIPLCTLAAAYAEEGRFTNAIASATLSEQLASEQGMPALALQDLTMLNLFRSSQPYHESEHGQHE
jgi:tetratricopeptide (TPR) repeat protein